MRHAAQLADGCGSRTGDDSGDGGSGDPAASAANASAEPLDAPRIACSSQRARAGAYNKGHGDARHTTSASATSKSKPP